MHYNALNNNNNNLTSLSYIVEGCLHHFQDKLGVYIRSYFNLREHIKGNNKRHTHNSKVEIVKENTKW